MNTEEDPDFEEPEWTGLYVLDEKGNPMPERDIRVWGVWMAGRSQHLARTEFVGGVVSTIFLGIDFSASFFPMFDPLTYKPILWETMVFGGPFDQAQWRYTSREEALEGHRLAVEQCTLALKN